MCVCVVCVVCVCVCVCVCAFIGLFVCLLFYFYFIFILFPVVSTFFFLPPFPSFSLQAAQAFKAMSHVCKEQQAWWCMLNSWGTEFNFTEEE